MLTLTVNLQVKRGHLDDFLVAIEKNASSSFHDEPGCVYFDVAQALDDKHHFVFHEVYTDEAALEAHRTAPHFAAWREAASRHVVKGSQVNVMADRLFHHS